jgi:hypothetical protein
MRNTLQVTCRQEGSCGQRLLLGRSGAFCPDGARHTGAAQWMARMISVPTHAPLASQDTEISRLALAARVTGGVKRWRSRATCRVSRGGTKVAPLPACARCCSCAKGRVGQHAGARNLDQDSLPPSPQSAADDSACSIPCHTVVSSTCGHEAPSQTMGQRVRAEITASRDGSGDGRLRALHLGVFLMAIECANARGQRVAATYASEAGEL